MSSTVALNASCVLCGINARRRASSAGAPVAQRDAIESTSHPPRLRQPGERCDSNVVLPAPFGPAMHHISPGANVCVSPRPRRALHESRARNVRCVTLKSRSSSRASAAASTGTPARRSSAVITPTGNCAGAITVRATRSAPITATPPAERRRRQQHALIVAEREPQTHAARRARRSRSSLPSSPQRPPRATPPDTRANATASTATPSACAAASPRNSTLSCGAAGTIAHKRDGQRDQRGPWHRDAIQVAGQPEHHAAQSVLGRDGRASA